MNYTLFELKRLATDKEGIFFSVGLPVILYLIFGSATSYGDKPLNGGNINAYVMIGMALFAGATGAVSGASAAVVDYQSGWGRQLALTPLTHRHYLGAQTFSLFVRASLPVAAVYITGFFAGAQMPATAWALSCALCIAGAIPFGFYGATIAQLLRSYSAVNIASTSLVVLFFAANAFTPLSENLLKLAQYTPAYGLVALARFPLSDGAQLINDDPWFLDHSLSAAIVNTAAWSTILILSLFLTGRNRQQK